MTTRPPGLLAVLTDPYGWSAELWVDRPEQMIRVTVHEGREVRTERARLTHVDFDRRVAYYDVGWETR